LVQMYWVSLRGQRCMTMLPVLVPKKITSYALDNVIHVYVQSYEALHSKYFHFVSFVNTVKQFFFPTPTKISSILSYKIFV